MVKNIMDILRKIKESYLYEIIKEQSGIIIFAATILGSFLVLVTQISEYFYYLGRFNEYNIPMSFLETEKPSIYHIATVFAYIMCYIGGMATLISARMTCKTGLRVAKLQCDLDDNKKLYWKRIISNISVAFCLGACVIVINALIIILSTPKSISTIIILGLFLLVYQWFFSGQIIKEFEKKNIEKEDDIYFEKEEKMIEKLNELPEEKLKERTEQIILNSKSYIFLSKILPLVFIVIFSSFYCFGNYSSGKNSATSNEKPYQILTIHKEEYAVLGKMDDNYILAKSIVDDGNTLRVQINEQLLIPIENEKYILRVYRKVVLEG